MKYCPHCRRTYTDETISFCLDDGQLLTADYSGAPTLPISSALATDEKPTPVLKPAVPPERARKRIRTLWIVAGIVSLCGVIFYLILFGTVGAIDKPPIGAVLLSSVLGGLIYGYLVWSVCWGLPAVWAWWRGVTKEPLRFITSRLQFNWAVILVVLLFLGPALTILALYFWLPFLAAIVYGVFGGGIYHFLQFRRIATGASSQTGLQVNTQ